MMFLFLAYLSTRVPVLFHLFTENTEDEVKIGDDIEEGIERHTLFYACPMYYFTESSHQL